LALKVSTGIIIGIELEIIVNFIPELSVLLPFAAACVVLAITPGPDMALFVGRALTYGRAAGFACMAGALSGILVHTALVALGLAALMKAAPTAFWVLKLAGAAYLVWLAFDALKNGSSFTATRNTSATPKPLVQHYLTGLGINLLNPKIVMFFLTFLPQFVSASDPNAVGKLFFLGAMFNVVSLPIIIPMVWLADRFAAAMKANPKVTRATDYLFAGVFSYFAIKVITAQAK
jgi:threonine/homoserine/homoserine lactone efflux protein